MLFVKTSSLSSSLAKIPRQQDVLMYGSNTIPVSLRSSGPSANNYLISKKSKFHLCLHKLCSHDAYHRKLAHLDHSELHKL